MKLIKYDHYGVILLEPDDQEEMRADEPDHDDAEADVPRMVLTPEEARATASHTFANGSTVDWKFS